MGSLCHNEAAPTENEMWNRVIGIVGFIASLTTIFSFMGQVSSAGFQGNLFSDSTMKLPILQISYTEAGIAVLVLTSVSIFVAFKNSRLYARGMIYIVQATRSSNDDRIDPVFVVLLLMRYPIGYLWCKAFWPGDMLWMYSLIVTGVVFLTEYLCFLAYVNLMDD